MASRTRTHCPSCNTQYLPRARACAGCGRTRDQKTDAELAAVPQPAPIPRSTAPVAAPTPSTFWTPKGIAITAAAGLFFTFILIGRAVNGPKARPVPTQTTAVAAPIVLPVTAEDIAHEKAMAAKAERDMEDAEQANEDNLKAQEAAAAQTQYLQAVQGTPQPVAAQQGVYTGGERVHYRTGRIATGGRRSHHKKR